MSDILMPKGPGMQGAKDAVVERLRRRMGTYRKHHDDCGPRFEHTINGLNDQQKQETLALRQRFLESKPKKSAKKSDKSKQQDGSNNTGSQKLQKRQCEDIDLGPGGNGGSDSYEPPAKMAVCGAGVNGSMGGSNSGQGSFTHHQGHSPSQAHPGEMSSSGVNSLQSVKSLSLAKPTSGSSAPPINSPIPDPRGGMGINGPASNSSFSSTNNLSIEFKQEPNSAFVDLDECAAALEKDAAENGSIMSGLMGMGDDPNEGMINYDTLKDLISEISDNPDFMKDFDDFDDDHESDNHKNLGGGTPSGLSSNHHHHHPHPHSHHPHHPPPNHIQSTNGNSSCADNNPSFGSHGGGGSHSRTPPVAPVTPTTTSSPRLNLVKMESDGGGSGLPSDSGCGNRGLSHCAGPSPAAASTASPLASQLNSHQPSQTPPYSSGSAIFDSASPSGAQGQNPLTPNSNSNNFCPTSSTPTPHNSVVSGVNAKGARVPYTSPGSLTLDSPAAQTLKQMAEQHQHKAQLGMSTFKPNPGSNPSPARSPFSGDSYGFSGSGGGGEFPGSGNINVSSGGSNSSNYSNVSVRTQSSGVPSVSGGGGGGGGGGVGDSMVGMSMPIKQEANMYSHQSNFPSMDMKRNNNVNHNVRHSQPPPPTVSQTQQQQLKGPANNSLRLPNAAMLQQQQQQQQSQPQPPLYSNKSFTHANSAGSQLGSSVNAAGVSASHMASTPHSQPFMNRSPNSGMSAVPPSNYPPTSHSGYQGSVNHSAVQLNQTQPISIPQSNPAASLPVSSSGSQQMGGGGDMKSSIMSASIQSPNFYYQNQGVGSHSQMHHQQQQQQQQQHPSSQSQVSESAAFINSSSVQSNPNNPLASGGNNQGQTINFTQQHLRMSTGMPPSGPGGMSRMMGPGPGPPIPGGPPGGGMTRMGMPPRMSTPPGAGSNMNEMVMGPRMELQQRMMRQQQIRAQSIPPQQMMRPGGPGEMMSQQQQQMMAAQGSMMNRFPNMPSNSPTASGPGRPGLGPVPSGPSVMGGGGPGSNMASMRMQGNMYGPGPGHGMPSVGGNNNLPMGGNMGMGNVSMAMRRMPAFNSVSGGVGSNPSANVPGRPGGGGPGMNHSMMMSSQAQQQQPVGASNDWVGMSDPTMRSYPGANMQQQSHPSMRGANPAAFHPGMPMQMAQQQQQQQQQQHALGQLQRGDGSMCSGVPVGSQPGNPMGSMGYSQQQQKPPPQQQQIPVGGNPGNFPQMSMGVNKMSQSQANMCMSSNFTMKSGGGMAISNSGGSGGTMMCANSQSMNQMCNTMKTSNTDMTNQDFNFDLLENITTSDASSFNADSDFLSSFDSNPNYHNILDSL